MRLLVTGASGFIGSELLRNPLFSEAAVMGRTKPLHSNEFHKFEIGPDTDYGCLLRDFETIVHVAGRAHKMQERVVDANIEHHKTNYLSTMNLAHQAKVSGVKHFIFISSLKVLGESSPRGKSLYWDSSYSPQDPYSLSKANAEEGLKKISNTESFFYTIIRPPLVYGNGAKGNFEKLIKLSNSFVPLPFASVNNKRSLVYVKNLVDLVAECILNENSRNKIFNVSDGVDMSLPELVSALRIGQSLPRHLFPVSPAILKLIASIIGKKSAVDRLLGSMSTDIHHTEQTLNWTPPYTTQAAITEMFERKGH